MVVLEPEARFSASAMLPCTVISRAASTSGVAVASGGGSTGSAAKAWEANRVAPSKNVCAARSGLAARCDKQRLAGRGDRADSVAISIEGFDRRPQGTRDVRVPSLLQGLRRIIRALHRATRRVHDRSR